LLSRSQISFTCLDTIRGGSSLFAADIPILESSNGYDEDLRVLVVHEETEQRHFLVERVQNRRYALCRLASWFRMDDFVKLEKPCDELRIQSKRIAREVPQCGGAWWAKASVSVEPPVGCAASVEPPKDATNQVKTVSKATHSPVVGNRVLPDNQDSLKQSAFQVEANPEAGEEASKLDADRTQNPLEELTRQYLDALYLSRTSLAYFSKGPMARARAAFCGTTDSSGPVTDLINFLRSAILSSDVMDKKYREHLADLIKEVSPDGTADTKSKPSKKRKWKAKRDKLGFFTIERENAEKWWRVTNEQMIPTQDQDTHLHEYSSRLRNREMFLQIMLILEILALESTASSEKGSADTLNSQTKESEEQGNAKRKKKKEMDISAVLESLLDRLCIWYSLASSTPSKPEAGSTGKKHDPSDEMRGFCTEIIIPFYMSRIPQQASMVSKRLGGPRGPTVLGRKPSDGPNKPGEPASRKVPDKKPRKPLTRVSTDTLNQVGRQVPSLQRSATDLEPLIKRERSETPRFMADVPPARSRKHAPGPVSTKRASLLHEVSFSKREVDLSAMSQASEAKVRKKAEVEQKLRDAISTLKKPNRALAVEDVAKSTDESFAKAIARSRPSVGQRKASERTNQIMITATPRHTKSFSSRRQRMQAEQSSLEHSEPTPAVPSSSARLKASNFQIPGSTPAVPQTGHRSRTVVDVADTPSRGFAKFMPMGLARPPGTLLESPTAMRSAPVDQTPMRCRKMPMLLATPAARYSQPHRHPDESQEEEIHEDSASDVPVESASQSRELHTAGRERGSNTIYDALGWDDSYEDLL
jgi:hypothetical protein